MRVWLLMLSAIAFVHTAFGQKIDSFLPKTPTETAVIVCSGGSYFWSANKTESASGAWYCGLCASLSHGWHPAFHHP